ncbi:MAG: hypothetical protein HOF55_03055 [Candidatus Marinimicrobia bacterium]|nr:hypothetical protein [Candidatus Neomarinimicrobiota bacterium]MBT3828747.1 hypothetical protein [Candidatus Neomarinimicrobiota bacterium]
MTVIKHIRIFLMFLIISVNSGQSQVSHTFQLEGYARNFLVDLPDSVENSLPLIFNNHGYFGSASQQRSYSVMHTVAADLDLDVIIVYPDAISTAWNSGIDDYWLSPTPDVDDVNFFSVMIDSMFAWYAIDTNRVFSCGMSNGGFMSYRLGCELSDRITAIASVTGTMASSIYASCDPSRPVPLMEIHGTNDPTVPYLGTSYWMSTDQSVQYWVANNNCGDTPTFEDLPDMDQTDNSTVDKYTYSDCDEDADVILFEVDGGGHSWPSAGGLGGVGTINQDISASAEILNFFLQYSQDSGSAFPSGDLDGDGDADLSDLSILVFAIMGFTETTDHYLNSGDLNRDGQLGVADILLFSDTY